METSSGENALQIAEKECSDSHTQDNQDTLGYLRGMWALLCVGVCACVGMCVCACVCREMLAMSSVMFSHVTAQLYACLVNDV